MPSMLKIKCLREQRGFEVKERIVELYTRRLE